MHLKDLHRRHSTHRPRLLVRQMTLNLQQQQEQQHIYSLLDVHRMSNFSKNIKIHRGENLS